MERKKYHFGIGLVIGIVAAGLFFHFYAPRYITVEAKEGLIKQDKWSGDSWRLVGDKWKKISDSEKDWHDVDRSLRKAFQTTVGGAETAYLLEQLKKKYPKLKNVRDEDLLVRIRAVYSQEILTRNYLDNILKEEQGSDSME